MSYKILKNAGMVPTEIEIRKEIISLQKLISLCQDDNENKKLTKQMNEKQRTVKIMMEKKVLGGLKNKDTRQRFWENWHFKDDDGATMKKWILDKEKVLAKSLLKKKHVKEGKDMPPDSKLDKDAEKVVTKANKILKDRSKHALNDLKQSAKEFWKEVKKP